MKYNELYELLNKQHTRSNQLRRDLLNNALQLRDAVSTIIEAPEGMWKNHDSGQTGRYVEAALSTEGFPPLNIANIHKSPQEDGCLTFTIKIGLAAGVNIFPIRYFHQRVGIKFKKEKPQFSIINSTTGKPESWETDHQKICRKLIDMLAKYLSYDPYDGEQNESSIGFGLEEINETKTLL